MNDKAVAAQEALQRDGAKVREKINRGEPLTLFDVLESIGATMDMHWHGEWTGPIMFADHKGAHRLILVEDSDHAEFDAWLQEHPPDSVEARQLRETFHPMDPWVNMLQDYARHALVRMCSRPIDPKDCE